MDLIDRQAAIDVVNGIDSEFAKYIEELPSAQPQRKKGEWEMPYGTTTMVSRCSLCGSYGQRTLNFCPNCGADMRGEE